MAQLCLDKTAEEFRVLHQERQVAIDKWKEATDIIEKRDEELQKIFSEVLLWFLTCISYGSCKICVFFSG